MPDKSLASTTEAIKHFKGDRIIQILCYDGSGENYKGVARTAKLPLRRVSQEYRKITLCQNEQCRMFCTVLALLWYALAFLLVLGNSRSNVKVLMGTVTPMGQSAELDASSASSWKLTHGGEFRSELLSFGFNVLLVQPNTKRKGWSKQNGCSIDHGCLCRLRTGAWMSMDWAISCLLSRRICRIRCGYISMPAIQEAKTRKSCRDG